ncbi:MAG: PleD family two-component system response regulator [Candidatus Kapaibacterium sp.]
MEYSVLIIDDDVWMQRILSKTLQSYGFKKTYLASNGFDGIAVAVDKQPTLIILDILMPELTGHMALKILKKIKYTRDIPVLMVSALSDVENLGMAVKSGTAGFISKPFTRATVYEKLVNIWGVDKLDKISKGEPIDTSIEYYNEEALDMKQPEPQPQEAAEPGEHTEDQEKPAKSAQQEQILKRYQDDEKRSIESIKKLLLKSKK